MAASDRGSAVSVGVPDLSPHFFSPPRALFLASLYAKKGSPLSSRQGSRCGMWIPPEDKDPVVFHHPTRKSVGYFGAVCLHDGRFLFRREVGRFNGETFWDFLRYLHEA